MTRSRATAKQAGSLFERSIADYLAVALNDDRIDRRVKTGAKDKGDIFLAQDVRDVSLGF